MSLHEWTKLIDQHQTDIQIPAETMVADRTPLITTSNVKNDSLRTHMADLSGKQPCQRAVPTDLPWVNVPLASTK